MYFRWQFNCIELTIVIKVPACVRNSLLSKMLMFKGSAINLIISIYIGIYCVQPVTVLTCAKVNIKMTHREL